MRWLGAARWRRCAPIGLALFALAALATPAAWLRARWRLDARVADVTRRLALERDAPSERPPLIGEPMDGDAFDDYAGLEPAIPFAPGDVFPQADKVLEGKPPTPAALAMVPSVLALRPKVQEGLRRRRCRVPLEVQDELRRQITPDLVALRSYAAILAIAAAASTDPDDAASIGLELVALGADLQRSGVITTLVGVAIIATGVRSLVLTLSTRELPRATYARITSTLGRVPEPDPERLARAARLIGECELARRCGRTVDGRAILPEERLGVLEIDLAWTSYLERVEAAEAVQRLPRAERGGAARMLRDGPGPQFGWTRPIATPIDLFETELSLTDGVVLVRIARALAAAHLHRLDRGAFPGTIADLTPYLGAAPQDPFTEGAPLGLSLQGGVVICWSIGEDLIDQGGACGANHYKPDIAWTTTAPPGR